MQKYGIMVPWQAQYNMQVMIEQSFNIEME
jgi:hypothetical protein